MPRISTHVLDTSLGRPAAGVAIELFRGLIPVAVTGTNFDGRTDQPLLECELIEPGGYDLIFHVGDYLRSAANGREPFYETISVSFIVKNGLENYHIPLLLSPYGYSTYRGS